ncbi:MAG: DUF362 domain-containing protein, partial [Clostridia bacterium]|nr:DUF362 domain-containing protein [Clostridia bacterium]
MPAVSVRCVPDYDNPDALYTAVDAHFEALGVAEELTPETRVLLKPNLLAGRAPESAVTTHPALLRAVAQWLRNHGVTKIVLADSPGGIYTPGSLRRVYAACGLNDLSDVLTLNENTACGERDGFT